MSFHGVPARTLELGRPLPLRVLRNRALAGRTPGLEYSMSILFSPDWDAPNGWNLHTEPTLIAMAKAGVKRVDVELPGLHQRLPNA